MDPTGRSRGRSREQDRRQVLLPVLAMVVGLAALWSVSVVVMDHLIGRDQVSGSSSVPATSPSPQPAPTEPAVPDDLEYVAIGDSYTAGPGIEPQEVDSRGCSRSAMGYPALIARQLDAEVFRNVSCTGAETSDVRFPQVVLGVEHPPQLAAVRPSTDLVTVGLGANDEAVFTRVVTRCSGAATLGNPCQEVFRSEGQDMHAAAARMSGRLVAVLSRVKERAPRARIVVVGYLRLVPDQAGCQELPFAARDVPYIASVLRALRDAQAEAAEAAGVEFLDAWTLSEGRDACSALPWVNGPASSDAQDGTSLHPNAEGMRALAQAFLADFAADARRDRGS